MKQEKKSKMTPFPANLFTDQLAVLGTFVDVPRSRHDEIMERIKGDEHRREEKLHIALFRPHDGQTESDPLGEMSVLSIWRPTTRVKFLQERLEDVLASYHMTWAKRQSSIVYTCYVNPEYGLDRLPDSTVLISSAYHGTTLKQYDAVLSEVGGLLPGTILHIAGISLADPTFHTGIVYDVWESAELAEQGYRDSVTPVLARHNLTIPIPDLTASVQSITLRERVTSKK